MTDTIQQNVAAVREGMAMGFPRNPDLFAICQRFVRMAERHTTDRSESPNPERVEESVMTYRKKMIARVQLAQTTVLDGHTTDADRDRSAEFLARPSTLAFIETMNDEPPTQVAAPLTVMLATAILALAMFGCMIASVPVPAAAKPSMPPPVLEKPKDSSGWDQRCGCDSKGGYCIHFNRTTREISFQDLTADACVKGVLVDPPVSWAVTQ